MKQFILRLIAGGTAVAWMVYLAAPVWTQAEPPTEVTRAMRQAYGHGEIRTFDREIDLSGDGRPGIVVYVVGPMVCGTGRCNPRVFAPTDTVYRRVADISVSADVELALNGRSYPHNPTRPGPRVRPAGLTSTELLIDEFKSMTGGRMLAAATPAPSKAGAQRGSSPSFDCAKAKKSSEKIVCGDADLSALDRTLAAAYAKGLSVSSEWTEADRSASRAAQRAWLAERDRCANSGNPKDCVMSAYRRRIAELQIRNGDLGPVPATVDYRCQGLEGTPVTAVYYSQTEPPSAVITVGDKQVIAFIARSGSGARYIAAGAELWEHHGEATLTWIGKTYTCKVP